MVLLERMEWILSEVRYTSIHTVGRTIAPLRAVYLPRTTYDDTHSTRYSDSNTEKFCHGALAGLCAFIVCGCAIYCCNDECNQRKAHKKEAPAGRKHSEFETESEYVEYDMVSPSAPVDLEIELEEVMLLQNRISNHNSPTMTRDYGESEGVSEYDDIKQWFENETVLKEDEIEEYFDTFIANGFTDLKIIKMITDNMI
eukprot:115477_1